MTCDMWHMKCDMWHMTCDMWHMKCDMWHMTCDMWYIMGVHILSKFQLPSFYGLWLMIFEDFEDKADSLTELKNELMTKVFVEQPPTLGLLNTLDSASRMQKKKY